LLRGRGAGLSFGMDAMPSSLNVTRTAQRVSGSADRPSSVASVRQEQRRGQVGCSSHPLGVIAPFRRRARSLPLLSHRQALDSRINEKDRQDCRPSGSQQPAPDGDTTPFPSGDLPWERNGIALLETETDSSDVRTCGRKLLLMIMWVVIPPTKTTASASTAAISAAVRTSVGSTRGSPLTSPE